MELKGRGYVSLTLICIHQITNEEILKPFSIYSTSSELGIDKNMKYTKSDYKTLKKE